MSGSTSINNPEPKVENFPAEGEGIVNETGLEQSLSELAVGQAQESPASETDNTTAPGRGGSEDPPETSQVDEANENNNPRERPTVTISETESNVIWVQGTPFYITNEPPFRLNRPESADLNSARPASGMSSSSQPDNNHEDQEIDVTNNTPDRFELFLLGPGEKKVTEEIDTRMPNTSIFTFSKEDHTLGNLLRAHLLKHQHVVFSGYKMGHPLVSSFELRVSTDGTITPRQAVVQTCKELVSNLGELSRQFTREMELYRIAHQNGGQGNGGNGPAGGEGPAGGA